MFFLQGFCFVLSLICISSADDSCQKTAYKKLFLKTVVPMLKQLFEKLPLSKDHREMSKLAIAPALLFGTALSWSLMAPTAQAVSFTTNRDSLNATDQLDWSTLGPIFSPFGPPDPAIFLPSSFTATSEAGRAVQVEIPEATTPGVLPPFVFQTTPEPGIATNFGNGDYILFTGLIPGPTPAVGNPGPITLTFAEPVFGAGAQLAVDDIFNFTGTISAFDSEDQLLGSFSAPGTSSLALDNAALFLGVTDEQPIISKLEFKSSVPNSAIGLNQLSLVTRRNSEATDIPEHSSLVAFGALLAFGYQSRRRWP